MKEVGRGERSERKRVELSGGERHSRKELKELPHCPGNSQLLPPEARWGEGGETEICHGKGGFVWWLRETEGSQTGSGAPQRSNTCSWAGLSQQTQAQGWTDEKGTRFPFFQDLSESHTKELRAHSNQPYQPPWEQTAMEGESTLAC